MMKLIKKILTKYIFSKPNKKIIYTKSEYNSIFMYEKDVKFHCDFFGRTNIKDISPIKMFEFGALSIEDLYEFRKNSTFSEEVIEYFKNNFPDLYEKCSFETNLSGF